MAASSKYACSCGRTFSFESVLMRHCKQTGHEPATGPVEEAPRPVMASVQAAAEMAKAQGQSTTVPAAAVAPAPVPVQQPPAPAPAPAPEPAPTPPPPAPKAAPAPARPAPPPPQPEPVAEPEAPEPAPPAEEPPVVEALPPSAATAPEEQPLIYEAALRVLMAKQSAWQSAPRPSLKTRILRRLRPQLELVDRSLNGVQKQVNVAGSKTKPYMSVILAIPISLVLIWTGYRLAKALMMLPK